MKAWNVGCVSTRDLDDFQQLYSYTNFFLFKCLLYAHFTYDSQKTEDRKMEF